MVANGDSQGNFVEGCLSGPFGDGQDCTPNYDYTETHFTDKLRDQESTLDYFGARYFNSILGRFTSPDWSSEPEAVPFADLMNPQSLNLYSYTRNNPLNIADPNGHNGFTDFLRDQWQRVSNDFSGFGYNNDKQVADNLHQANQYLRQHGVLTEGMRDAAILKTYQTYTKLNSQTGQTYSGRTSGTKTPEENVMMRDTGHHMNEQGYGPAQLDRSSTNPNAIRGREQQLIEGNGGAQSQGGTSGNAINGISPNNLNKTMYCNACESEVPTLPEELPAPLIEFPW